MKKKVRAIVAEKKIYVLLLLLCSNVMMFADGLTATLQHGTTMTAYFGQSALQSAYEAAADGDIITLSPGGFNPVAEIAKSVRIVGAYGLDATDSYGTFINAEFIISADNVKLEGMYFQSNVTLGAIKNCTFKRCYILYLLQSGTHTNTLIDQCVLMYDYAIETGVNYSIKNSTINSFASNNSAVNVANITNCFIQYTNTYVKAIYKNNVLRLIAGTYSNNTYTFEAPNELYYNYMYNTNPNGYSYSSTVSYGAGCVNVNNTVSSLVKNPVSLFPDTTSFGVKGEDGTPVGMNGGEGFNKYPAIPRVLKASIDAQTDDKGKLNASITVQAEK